MVKASSNLLAEIVSGVLLYLTVVVIPVNAGAELGDEVVLRQPLPGRTPTLFAPGVVSTGDLEHSSPSFTLDGDEMYWAAAAPRARTMEIRHSRRDGSQWGAARVVSFSGGHVDGCPSISPDGKRLFFSSARGSATDTGGRSGDLDIWVVDRDGDSWGTPQRLPGTVNTAEREYCPAVAADGTLYFDGESAGLHDSHGLLFSEFNGGSYATRSPLPQPVLSESADFSPWPTSDERLLLFASSRPGGQGEADLYVSFRTADGSWGHPQNLGSLVNSAANERFPSLSRDGKVLYFVSDRRIAKAKPNEPGNGLGDVYWVDASIIEGLASGQVSRTLSGGT